jgi:hypothetical protein
MDEYHRLDSQAIRAQHVRRRGQLSSPPPAGARGQLRLAAESASSIPTIDAANGDFLTSFIKPLW